MISRGGYFIRRIHKIKQKEIIHKIIKRTIHDQIDHNRNGNNQYSDEKGYDKLEYFLIPLFIKTKDEYRNTEHDPYSDHIRS